MIINLSLMVGVAQLVRAPGCGSGGRGFKTHHPPHLHTSSNVSFRSSFYINIAYYIRFYTETIYLNTVEKQELLQDFILH